MLLRTSCPRLLFRPAQLPNINYSTTNSPGAGELRYPEPTPANHHDIHSFLDYASRVQLDPQSTTYVGTHYEYTVKASLSRLGFDLRHVGGRSDYGIDLLGTWQIPSIPLSLKVLLQCKALAKKSRPSVVRELEGAFVGAPTGWRGPGVLGLLVNRNPATKGVRDALARSRWPMGFVMCTGEGKVLQILWNKKAEEQGLLGIGVGMRYTSENAEGREVNLTWKGEAIKDQV